MAAILSRPQCVNTLRLRQYGRYFPDDIFKRICLNENVSISLKISLKFVPKVQFNNIPALLQIMVWRRPGDKPLSEPMVVSLLTHICVTRPQWVNAGPWVLFPDLIMFDKTHKFGSKSCSFLGHKSALVQERVWHPAVTQALWSRDAYMCQ